MDDAQAAADWRGSASTRRSKQSRHRTTSTERMTRLIADAG